MKQEGLSHVEVLQEGPSGYYATLGVTVNADKSTLAKSYKDRAARLHPDAGGNVEQFKQLATAWKTLSVPSKKIAYDTAQSKDSVQCSASITLELSAKQALSGGVYKQFVTCSHGVNEVTVRMLPKEALSYKQDQALLHTIPGHQLKYTVNIKIPELSLWEISDSDIKLQIPVLENELHTGTQVTVPVWSGTVTVLIPAGTPNGTTFNVKGKGLPTNEGHGCAKLRVVVNPDTDTWDVRVRNPETVDKKHFKELPWWSKRRKKK